MAIVALEKRYVCVRGAPTIDRVDTNIFTLRYFARCMACSFCRDQCCSYGVDIDAENVARLLARADAIEKATGVPRDRWVTGEWTEDAEFPGGRHTRTRADDGGCVFRDRAGRGCMLHAFALSEGLDYHELKPIVSALFPITFDGGLLHAADEAAAGELVCGGDGPTLYEGGRDELAYYFGAELVHELDAMAAAAR